MSRKGHKGVTMEGLMGSTKIRKRGCSSSSSSSSRVYNCRLNKRAILVGKNRAGLGIGLGRSRSSTPVPTWRTTPLRTAIESPRHSQTGKSTQPISARRLAATLWEMNEMPTPKMRESNLDGLKGQQKKSGSKMVFKREKTQSGWGLHSGSGPLPPHLSDPSHSPTASEKMDRSGTGSHRRSPSISHRLMLVDQNLRPIDSISNASLTEIETRSRPPVSSTSALSSSNRLKDTSNALTTSKELLKIISRMLTRTGPPLPSAPLISALHAELERARLHINYLIQDQSRPGPNKTDHLIKLLADEKSSWKKREQQQAVESAVGPIVAELEAERKLRRRLESLNKKLGKELTEVKSSLLKVVEELKNEKRAREITEEVCDELARNIDEERAEAERIKMESFKAHEEVEKEREMLELADKLREERVQMKLTDAKHQFEEKNCKLRKQLENFLRSKRDEIVEDGSEESDLHSIELNADKNRKWNRGMNDVKSRKSCCLQRSTSDGEFFDRELETENARNSYFDGRQRYSGVRGAGRDQVRSSSRLAEESWPSRDPFGGAVDDANGVVQTKGSKSRTGVVRRSKW